MLEIGLEVENAEEEDTDEGSGTALVVHEMCWNRIKLDRQIVWPEQL